MLSTYSYFITQYLCIVLRLLSKISMYVRITRRGFFLYKNTTCYARLKISDELSFSTFSKKRSEQLLKDSVEGFWANCCRFQNN